MQQSFRGHLVVLIDETTYSDGETFADGVRRLKLGTLIGKRTAGAGVWLTDRNRLLDNGMIRASENAQFTFDDGSWLIEGRASRPTSMSTTRRAPPRTAATRSCRRRSTT